MSPRTGRPPVENPRNNKIEIRMNDEELEKLDFCCEREKQSRSGVIRTGVENIYKSLTGDEKK